MIAILGLCLLDLNPAPRPLPKTRYFIEQCLDGIERSKFSEGSNLESRLLQSTNLNHALAELLHENPELAGVLSFSSNGPRLLLDGWETPLNVDIRSRIQTNAAAQSALKRLTNAVIIWSSGSNRSNEFGGGDDVVIER